MARTARLLKAGVCHHLCQMAPRGRPFWRDVEDRARYIQDFGEAAQGQGLLIHAWGIGPEAAHWLVTPQRPRTMAAVVQQIGRRYVRAFNARWALQGSPFLGRYRSYWVGEANTLQLALWMESLVDGPANSSAWLSGDAGGLDALPWALRACLRPPPALWALGNTPFERESAHREALRAFAGLEPSAQQAVARGLAQGVPWLSLSEQRELPVEWRDRLVARPRGRPRSSGSGLGIDLSPIKS